MVSTNISGGFECGPLPWKNPAHASDWFLPDTGTYPSGYSTFFNFYISQIVRYRIRQVTSGIRPDTQKAYKPSWQVSALLWPLRSIVPVTLSKEMYFWLFIVYTCELWGGSKYIEYGFGSRVTGILSILEKKLFKKLKRSGRKKFTLKNTFFKKQ